MHLFIHNLETQFLTKINSNVIKRRNRTNVNILHPNSTNKNTTNIKKKVIK